MNAFFQRFRGGVAVAASGSRPAITAAARVAPEVRRKVLRSIRFMMMAPGQVTEGRGRLGNNPASCSHDTAIWADVPEDAQSVSVWASRPRLADVWARRGLSHRPRAVPHGPTAEVPLSVPSGGDLPIGARIRQNGRPQPEAGWVPAVSRTSSDRTVGLMFPPAPWA